MCNRFFDMNFIDASQIITDQIEDSLIIFHLFFNTLSALLVTALLSQCAKKKGLPISKNASRSQSSSQMVSTTSANPNPVISAHNPTPPVEVPPQISAQNVDVPKEQQAAKPSSTPPDLVNKAIGNVVKPTSENDQKKDDPTQNDESIEDKKETVIDPTKVAKLGNLDFIAKEKRGEMLKEIETMKSSHEMEGEKDPSISAGRHVVIDEKHCKLYETNDEPTLDDELDDAI